jgi:hypothetical protein
MTCSDVEYALMMARNKGKTNAAEIPPAMPREERKA